jgi:Fe-S-cluster containining protein
VSGFVILHLSKSYPARSGVPSIFAVDSAIFRLKYFTHCSQCTFCHDWCCSFGVEIDLENVKRIQSHADELQKLVSVPQNDWFENEIEEDVEFEGGRYTGTNVVHGACIFLNRSDRGCQLHSFSIQKGIDYHMLKPIVCVIYPLTFSEGVLVPADEVEDQSLVCLGSGSTLYRALRDELAYYFGPAFVEELDKIEQTERKQEGTELSLRR